jgi:hypothetical protein
LLRPWPASGGPGPEATTDLAADSLPPSARQRTRAKKRGLALTEEFVRSKVIEGDMATTVAEMTQTELREMIETIIEQKLFELLGDPDEGLPIRKSLRDRLLRQRQAVVGGQRGEPLEDVVRRLGLE